jgi:ferritin-like protein
MAGETLHEERAVLSKEILDRHRALSTIMEELEAIDWYDQRIAASDNAELRAVLTHNRDEEKEHASMLLEWVRRHDSAFDRQMSAQLFNKGAIRETKAIEEAASAGKAGSAGKSDASPGKVSPGNGSLGVGSLRAAR